MPRKPNSKDLLKKFKDLDIPIIPDFVIDDYPEVVAYAD